MVLSNSTFDEKMDSRERFFSTIRYNDVDYPASWLGIPDPNAIPRLLRYFTCNPLEEIKDIVEDDSGR